MADGLCCVGVATVATNREWMNGRDIFILSREGGIHKHNGAGAVQGTCRAKGDGSIHIFGCAVHPASFGAVKGQFLPVLGEKVLPKEFSLFFE